MTHEPAKQTTQLLTVVQAAEKLCTSDQFIRRKVRTGELKAINLGQRTIRIAQEDLDAWLSKQSNHPLEQPVQFRKGSA